MPGVSLEAGYDLGSDCFLPFSLTVHLGWRELLAVAGDSGLLGCKGSFPVAWLTAGYPVPRDLDSGANLLLALPNGALLELCVPREERGLYACLCDADHGWEAEAPGAAL